ncbi:MAG: hypothetical protein ACRC0X_04000 [Brevinema sp.]
MKLIIGVYDRELSHHLAVILSSKKIIPIEAESMEEIPSLLELHQNAMLLCEETSFEFYQQLQQKKRLIDVFLLYHPSLETLELLQLRQFGFIKSVIPYTEDAYTIIESIVKQLSMLAHDLKTEDKSTLMPKPHVTSQVAVHMINTKQWAYGTLLGLNSSKVSIKLDNSDFVQDILDSKISDNILMYLQGLNIRVFADLVYTDHQHLVFRYRKMSKDDAQRLAYFINYCQTNPATVTKMTMSI